MNRFTHHCEPTLSLAHLHSLDSAVLRALCGLARVLPTVGFQLWKECIHSMRVSKDEAGIILIWLCSFLLLDLYTLKGNAHGTPCMFPFQYNHQWHHECTREGREDKLLWCATTSRYERDEKWGFCPDPSKSESPLPPLSWMNQGLLESYLYLKESTGIDILNSE